MTETPRPRRAFPIGPEHRDRRVESFLRNDLGLDRPTALKAIRKGWVRLDGSRVKTQTRLEPGQTLKITNYGLPLPLIDQPPAPTRPDVPSADVEAARRSIRAETPDWLVSLKPAGHVVHAGSGHPWGWVDALGAALDEPAPTPIGRLDRDTSGLLILARTAPARRDLFAALKTGHVARTYEALVFGQLRPDRGTIDLALARTETGVRPDETGKPARSRFEVLERWADASRVRLQLDTGRTHQLRTHLAARGHPILGDPRYGNDASRALTRALGLPHLALHAGRLDLAHLDPPQTYVADPPRTWSQAVSRRNA